MRIAFSILLLFSILFMPFYISMFLALIGMAYFAFFIEAIFLFFLIDLLYGVKEIRYHNNIFLSLLIITIIFISIEIIKKKLKFYPASRL